MIQSSVCIIYGGRIQCHMFCILSGCVSLGPKPGHPVVLLSVLQKLSGYAAYQRVSRVAVCQQGADTQQNLGHGQSRTPIVLQDVEADDALGVDVAVVDTGAECDFGWLERVFCREVNVEKEDTSFISRSGRPKDGRDPVIQIVPLWSSTTVRRGIQRNFSQLFLDTLCRCAQRLCHFWWGLVFLQTLWCFMVCFHTWLSLAHLSLVEVNQAIL